MRDRWVVMQEERRRRQGGDLRRAHVFRALAERTSAASTGWGTGELRRALRVASAGRFPWSPRSRPLLASTEILTLEALDLAAAESRPCLLDVHDDPAAQLKALGVTLAADRQTALADRVRRNRDAFELHVAPTASFAALAGLPPERTIVAPNGTDTHHVRPIPFPDQAAVGFVSGAAPTRGIETLVAAARLLRGTRPGLRLLLWLVATGDESAAYLAELRLELAGDPWIEIGPAPYERLGEELGRASVLCVPHPPGPYFDVALPVKLLDSMAAGRPVAITPRTESAAVVERFEAGCVASGDRPEDLAVAVEQLLADPVLAARLGANARAAAETTFDWTVIADRLADTALARLGG